MLYVAPESAPAKISSQYKEKNLLHVRRHSDKFKWKLDCNILLSLCHKI